MKEMSASSVCWQLQLCSSLKWIDWCLQLKLLKTTGLYGEGSAAHLLIRRYAKDVGQGQVAGVAALEEPGNLAIDQHLHRQPHESSAMSNSAASNPMSNP